MKNTIEVFNLLMNTTCAGHYSLGNVREVMKRAAKNCSLNLYADKMLRTTLNVKIRGLDLTEVEEDWKTTEVDLQCKSKYFILQRDSISLMSEPKTTCQNRL